MLDIYRNKKKVNNNISDHHSSDVKDAIFIYFNL